MRRRLRFIMTELINRLARVPGLIVKPGELLSKHTTMRVGGAAELFVEVGDGSALSVLLLELGQAGIGIRILGLGSNILFPDDGIGAAVVRFEGEFKQYTVSGDRVRAGAAMPLAQLARKMATEGLCGLEALSGFPSTVGGAVIMNAGCYGTEIKDVLVTAEIVRQDGLSQVLKVADLAPAYRSTNLQHSTSIVTAATFQLRRGNAKAAVAKIEELNSRRRASLPSGLPNSGSIFKNPPGDSAGRLLDDCGLKGAECGGAQVSRTHANVIVNRGGARAADVLELMLRMRRAVQEKFDVALNPEVVLVGELRERWDEAVRGAN